MNTIKDDTMNSTMKKMWRILPAVVCVAALGTMSTMSAACNKAANTPGGAAGGVHVTSLDLGRSLAADKAIADNASDFKPSDTIYLSVETDGSAPNATLTSRWTYQDGQLVKELSETIAPAGKARTEFHIVDPGGLPVGKYAVAVSLNGAAAGSKDFEVK